MTRRYPQAGETSICEKGCAGSVPSVASNAIPNVLQALGAFAVVVEAANQFQATAADRNSGEQRIDAYERAFRGETGNPTADALAQRGLTDDPLGTQQTAERIAEARGDLSTNTGVRSTNTGVGSGAALLTGPAAPITSAVIGVGTMVADAALREAHDAILSGLERSMSELTQRARDVIRNAQTPDITNTLGGAPGSSVQPRVDGRCEAPIDADPGAGQALIVVNAVEDDGRTITFRSVVQLTNPSVPLAQFGRNFIGRSTGPFREHFVSDQCSFEITWTGEVAVDVLARIDEHEVSASIGGPSRRQEIGPAANASTGPTTRQTAHPPNEALATRVDLKTWTLSGAASIGARPPRTRRTHMDARSISAR